MEAADDICYQIMDAEDAHKLKIVNHQEVADLFLGFFEDNRAAQMRRTMARLDDPNERVAYLRSNVIGALVEDCARVFVENEDGILSGKMQGSLVERPNPCSAKHTPPAPKSMGENLQGT